MSAAVQQRAFRTPFDIVAEVEAGNVCEVSGGTLEHFFGAGDDYGKGLRAFCERYGYERAQRVGYSGALCDMVVFYKMRDARFTDWQQAVEAPDPADAARLAAEEIEAAQFEKVAEA